jgi:ubiquinone/menaquinone biosynthesis C-methylase UbiE
MEQQVNKAGINVWNMWARIYDTLPVLQKLSLTPTRRDIVAEISKLLNPEKEFRILDMGCGTGQLYEDLRANFTGRKIGYTGVDLSPAMIEAAREKRPGASFTVSGIDDYTAGDGAFDCIVCAHSFPYYPDKKGAIEKFHRMLAPGGTLLLVQGSVNGLYDRIILTIIKAGAWKGEYPGIEKMNGMLKDLFSVKKTFKVNEHWWLASIAFFVCKKR